jgi:hypothetical protein
MNIYEKLQKMRVELQQLNIKKSGKNTYAGYEYFELGDFMPPINQLMKDNGVCSIVTYGSEAATLTLINVEKPEEAIFFTSPMAEAVLKGAHPIQNLGAVETYQRRYLYMTAFEIVEADALDATQGADSVNTARGSGNKQGRQNGGQRGAQKATQQKKQNTNLPDDISDQLNAAIKAAKAATGSSVAEIVAELEQLTGVKMQDVTVETAPNILAALDEIAGAELPF